MAGCRVHRPRSGHLRGQPAHDQPTFDGAILVGRGGQGAGDMRVNERGCGPAPLRGHHLASVDQGSVRPTSLIRTLTPVLLLSRPETPDHALFALFAIPELDLGAGEGVARALALIVGFSLVDELADDFVLGIVVAAVDDLDTAAIAA